MVKNFCFLLMGLGCGLYFWDVQPELPLRCAALALPNVWLGVSLFYAIPLVVAYFAARLCCKWREGVWWVTGSSIALIGLLTICWPSYLHCGFYGSCGNGVRGWLSVTAVLPSMVGKILVLFRDRCRRPSERRSLTRDLATHLRKLLAEHEQIRR